MMCTQTKDQLDQRGKLSQDELRKQTELFQEELKQQRKSQRRWLLIFSAVSLVVLIVVIFVSLVFIDSDYVLKLQQENASIERNYDYLQFVVPVLLAMGAFMAAALGVNRLKSLDDQIDKIESRFDKQFTTYKADILAAIDVKIGNEIEKKAKNYISELNSTTLVGKQELERLKEAIAKDIDSEKTSALGSMQSRFDGMDSKISDAKNLLNIFEQNYGWLKNRDNHINPDSITIESVADAHNMVEGLFIRTDMTRHERAQQVRVVVNKVLSDELSGDSADYHNLSAELARNELKDLAVQICERGLKFFPENVDLIADIIQYATQIGEETAGISIQEKIDDLSKIKPQSWTWRCFEFLSDYYISRRQYNDAEAVCNDYIRYLPRDERAYAQLSEIYGYLYSGIDAENKKIEILEDAVSKGFSCPRCANSLASLYADRGELEKAIRYSSIAILSLAQVQPSVNYAYVIYNRALYEDRLYLKKKLDGALDSNLLNAALKDYQDAMNSHSLSPITNNQAMVRYSILASESPDARKKQVVNPNPSGPDSGTDFISLLSQLASSGNSTPNDDQQHR